MTAYRHSIDPRGWFRPPVRRLLAVLAAAWLALVPVSVSAQEPGSAGSYITPFPDNDLYRVQVYGDSIAEGLLAGIVETFAGDTRLQVQRTRHALGSILRNEFVDEVQTIEGNLSRTPMHVVLVMVGLYDRYPWRPPNANRRVAVGSDEWKAEYSRRVDRLMKVFKARNSALYWVGLPIVKRPEWSDDYQRMNEVIREKAFLNGQKFVDVFQGFADDSGSFDNWGPDLTGKMKKMREGDGITFTWDGNRKLAHFVEREVKRDLTQARAERTVPLLGAEDEQKRIAPKPAAATPTQPQANPQAPVANLQPRSFAIGPGPAKPAAPGGEQPADPSRISLRVMTTQGKEETVVMDLPRPAIAANVVALVTRQQSSDKAVQIGDTVTDEIAGGVLVLSSITPVSSAGRRGLSPTQSPFYRVLIKGERLPPKIGRVDDFSWPPPADTGPPPARPASSQPTQPPVNERPPAKGKAPR